MFKILLDKHMDKKNLAGYGKNYLRQMYRSACTSCVEGPVSVQFGSMTVKRNSGLSGVMPNMKTIL